MALNSPILLAGAGVLCCDHLDVDWGLEQKETCFLTSMRCSPVGFREEGRRMRPARSRMLPAGSLALHDAATELAKVSPVTPCG